MRCETAVAILASEGLALVSVSRQSGLELINGAFVLTTFLFPFSQFSLETQRPQLPSKEDTSSVTGHCVKMYNFWIFSFFGFFLKGNWSLRTNPLPSSRVDFFSASSSCRVNYNQG